MNEINGRINKEKKFDIIPILAIIGFYFIESFAAVMAMAISQGHELQYSITWIISKIIPLVLVCIIFKNKFKESAIKTGSNFKKFLLFTIVAFGIFFLFELGTSYYQMVMDKLFKIGESTNQEGIYEYFLASKKILNYVLLFITVVILAPLLEELEFRVLVFDSFKGCHFIVPVIVSALGFGLLHMDFTKLFSSNGLQELMYLPIYTLPGFALALMYHYSNHNFFTNTLVHMAVNMISFVQIMQMINNGTLV